MSKMSRAVVVAAGLSLLVIGGQAQGEDLTADQYVRALTEHLNSGGSLDGAAESNVRQLVAGEQGGVGQEDFVELGNALYSSGHGGLADQVMQSNVVAPEQYEGAELSVEWPHSDASSR